MPVTVVLVGEGQAAGTEISLPTGIKAKAILSAVKATLTEGTPNKFTVTSLTVTSETPGSGEIQLYSESSIKLGDEFATTDILILTLLEKSEIVEPTSVST